MTSLIFAFQQSSELGVEEVQLRNLSWSKILQKGVDPKLKRKGMWWLPTASEQMNEGMMSGGGGGGEVGGGRGKAGLGMMRGDGGLEGDQETRDLLKLAVEQRMNTDLRRRVEASPPQYLGFSHFKLISNP